MMNRHDSVDIRIGRQRVALEMVGDQAAYVRRAVHAAHHADVVARGHAAICADDAEECRGIGDEGSRLVVLAKRIVALEAGHAEVVHVYVLTGPDRARGKADDLVVAAYRRAFRNIARGDLVAGGDRHRDSDIFLDDLGAGGKLDAGDHHVVRGVQADSQIGSLQHGVLLKSSALVKRIESVILRCLGAPAG
jgi:hypothetical protein